MALRRYGIYLAFSPFSKLNQEGLGRYLASFILASAHTPNTRIAIACPSWMRKPLAELLDGVGVPPAQYDLVGPSRQPATLQVFNWLRKIAGPRNFVFAAGRSLRDRRPKLLSLLALLLLMMLVAGMLLTTVAAGVFYATPLLLLIISLAAAVFVGRKFVKRSLWAIARRFNKPSIRLLLGRVRAGLSVSKLRNQIYDWVHRRESQRLSDIIKRQTNDIVAWYCPTAFWPAFNEIEGPRLTCLPDLVVSEFPAAYAQLTAGRITSTYRNIETTIRGSQHIVTYSRRVAETIVMKRFGLASEQVSTIRHASNDLSPHITFAGYDGERASEARLAFVRSQIRNAIVKANVGSYTGAFANSDVRFIFYASQFRPSKNVVNLLRAYTYLLRHKFITQKLFLTGRASELPSIRKFIHENFLENDVLCMAGLTNSELASCYSLAELAVNPSLSEGGMPFTFTEALSVGTPVIMGDIEVTREILTDPELASATLFDPHDWRAMANKIEWALANRDELYTRQRAFYEEHLATRTWDDVVAEHIALLDRIANSKQLAG